jgi:peptidoglycan/LPS O-acetylase OafA/YrhL
MRKIETLDGLRGYAILMVIYHHLPHIQGWTVFNRLPSLLRFGYLGVDIFFVLSGFLITRILINEKKKNNFSFKVFYFKRALRIFPIYYLLLIIIGITYSWNDMLPNVFYVSNYFYSFSIAPHPLRHTWSLSVEEHFYLIWPLIMYYFTLSRAETIIKYWLPAFAILSAGITAIIIEDKVAQSLIYRGTQYRILSLSLGGLFAFKEESISQLKPLYLFLAAVVLMILYYFIEHPGVFNTLLNFSLLTIVSALIFLFALNAGRKETLIKKIFVHPVITFTGKISYGLYLYHFPVLFFFGLTYNQIQGKHLNWQVIVMPLIITFIIAIISYFLIEKYFLRFKKNLSRT